MRFFVKSRREMKGFFFEDMPKISRKNDGPYSETDSLSSVISQPEGRDFGSEPSVENESETMQQRWAQLEVAYSRRDRELDRLTQGKNNAVVRQLRRRELNARCIERERLLLSELKSLRAASQKKYKTPTVKDSLSTSDGWLSLNWIYEMVFFAASTTLPATFCLFLHCIAHAAIYDAINVVIDEVRKVLLLMGVTNAGCKIHLAELVVGVASIRLSGYLYWWLNEQDYDLVKFDFHNRHRLQMWDARALYWVKCRPICRVALYTLGYHLCYSASLYLFSLLSFVADQSETLLEDLPSENCEDESSVMGDFLCSRSCHDELQRELDLNKTLVRLDMDFTWRVLTMSSYQDYWNSFVHGFNAEEEVALFSPAWMIFYSFTVTAICIIALSRYGFKFWENY